MANQTLKHLKYDNTEIQVESAVRDGSGNTISSTYATKSEVNDLDIPTISASSSEVSGATEAKSLNINGTDWNLPSGGGGGSGITEISTQYFRVWDLPAGVYKLTYNGTKYMYYNGTTNTATQPIEGSSGSVILTVSEYNNTYKHWWYINGTTGHASIYHGYTSSTSGLFGVTKEINKLATATGTKLYRHSITGFGSGTNKYTIEIICTRSSSIFPSMPLRVTMLREMFITGFVKIGSNIDTWRIVDINYKSSTSDTTNNGFVLSYLGTTSGMGTSVTINKNDSIDVIGKLSDTVTAL